MTQNQGTSESTPLLGVSPTDTPGFTFEGKYCSAWMKPVFMAASVVKCNHRRILLYILATKIPEKTEVSESTFKEIFVLYPFRYMQLEDVAAFYQ